MKKNTVLQNRTGSGKDRRTFGIQWWFPLALLCLISTNTPGGTLPGADRAVTGKVTNERGEALPWVNILVKGTLTGTVTTAEGEFAVTVPEEQAILVFSYVGYRSEEVPVGNRSTLNVVLKEATELSEVVVVGYGNESIKKLTTSVSTIKADQINDQPVANIADVFTGNVSGVFVDQASGRPGDVPVLRIRGYGSINAGSEPLYIIDGMIVTSSEFRLLNPKTIENISILKDAAAGAIYGSRAGNGVIIVTTKGGKGKPKFSYNATLGLNQVEKKIPVLSGPEYIDYARRAYEASGQPAPVFSSNVANTNWQDEIFRTAVFQNHQISANGSTDAVRYNLSFNYMGNQGTVLTLNEDQYSSNGMFDIRLNPKLNVGFNYTATAAKTRTNSKLGGPAHGGGGILEDAIVQYPVIPVYMPNGDYGQVDSEVWGTPVVYGGYGNPVAGLLEVDDRYQQFSGIGKGFLNFEPLPGLNLNASFMGRIRTNMRVFSESPYLAANGHHREANFSNPMYQDIVAGQNNELTSQYISEGYADYKKTIGEHQFNVVAGASMQYTGFRGTQANASVNDRGANATSPLPRFDNYFRPNIWGANDVSGGGGFFEETFTSVFGRLNYDYRDKYLFMASLRRDGSSKFAPGSRYGVFPAVSAAWRISDEAFLKDQKLVNDLKVRVSYGVSGNDQISNYAWQGSVSYGGRYLFGPTPGSDGVSLTAFPSRIENPRLRWETNEQYNAGLDLSMIDGRLQLTADYYIRNTRDMLMSRPLPSENGISGSVMDNIGNMTNKGLELALTTTNVSRPNFTWTTNWIFNKVWNKATAIHTADGILRLASGDFNSVWIIEGREMFQLYGYNVLGVFRTEEELQQHPRPRNAKVGDPILEDVDGDGQINSNDLQHLGSALPNFTFGLNNTFTMGNFDVNLIIDGSQGASKYLPLLRNQTWLSPTEGNVAKFLYEQSGTVYGDANLDYTGNRLTQNSYHFFDASYVRIKSLTVGYRLPAKVATKLSVSDLRLTFNIQNLHTFTSYPWYNPQANFYNGGAGSAQYGVDYGGVPLSRTYALGINLSF
jgi:TonB-linked SusC/RagA family outer membrane protein